VKPPIQATLGAPPKASKTRRKKIDTKILTDFHNSDYPTTGESEDDRKSGAKKHPLLLEISKPYREKPKPGYSSADAEGIKRVRCAGSKGCGTTWKWPRARQRIFKHAQDCAHLGEELRNEVITENAKRAVGPHPRIGGNSDARTEVGSEDEAHGDLRVVKRVRTESDMASSSTRGGRTLQDFVRAGRKELKDKGDHTLLVFLICCGIPPSVVDSREFKQFVSVLNSNYIPPCETTISDKLVPTEAARIHCAVINYLRGCRDLTITFDGGKLRSSMWWLERTVFCPCLHTRTSHVLHDIR
jgi:hypothetical protein